MKAHYALFTVALVAMGCNKGDGLVVVTLTATPTLANVAALRVDMTVGGTSRSHDIRGLALIDDSGSASFGVDVSADFGSSIAMQVRALDGTGAQLASGSGTATITPGQQTNLSIALSRTSEGDTADMASDTATDMATAVSSGDMAAAVDVGGVPQCTFDHDDFDNCVLAQ